MTQKLQIIFERSNMGEFSKIPNLKISQFDEAGSGFPGSRFPSHLAKILKIPGKKSETKSLRNQFQSAGASQRTHLLVVGWIKNRNTRLREAADVNFFFGHRVFKNSKSKKFSI